MRPSIRYDQSETKMKATGRTSTNGHHDISDCLAQESISEIEMRDAQNSSAQQHSLSTEHILPNSMNKSNYVDQKTDSGIDFNNTSFIHNEHFSFTDRIEVSIRNKPLPSNDAQDRMCRSLIDIDDRMCRTLSSISKPHHRAKATLSLPTYMKESLPSDSGLSSQSTLAMAEVSSTNNASDYGSYTNSIHWLEKETYHSLYGFSFGECLLTPKNFKVIHKLNSKTDSCNNQEKRLAEIKPSYAQLNVHSGERNLNDFILPTKTTDETGEMAIDVNNYLAAQQNVLIQLDRNQQKEADVCVTKDGRQDKKRKKSKENTNNKYKKLRQAGIIPKESFCSKYTSCRWVLAYMCFMGRFVQTALRQCMGVAILGMTMKKTIVVQENYNSSTENIQNLNWSEADNETNGLFNKTYTEQEMSWNSVFEGVLLASFNAGSIITPIIVGYLTTRHGGRRLMTYCLLCAGVSTVLLPVSARAHTSLIIVCRLITGIALSGSDSLIQAMWAKWAPHYELASMSSCSYSGLSVAGVLTFLVSGYLVTVEEDGRGWPYIFYVFGSMCLLLAPVWWLTVYDSPETHPRITKKELAIITYTKQPELFDDKQPLKTPWLKILKSTPVWVILMGHISNKWILSFMLSYLPRYFSDFFNFNLEMDGLLSSLPFAGRILSGLVTGYLSDYILRRGLSVCKTRKIFQGIGSFGCAIFSLLIAFIPSLTATWSITLLVLALSFQNVTSVAFRINLLDIAPRYAGLLNGLVSTVATVISLPAPVLTSLMIEGGSRDGWTAVFCLVAAFNLIGGIIFVIFAKGEVEDWARSDYINLDTADVEGAATPEQNETQVAVTESSAHINAIQLPKDQEMAKGRHLREVRSVPVTMREGSRMFFKEKIGRRATMDLGSMIKRVQNLNFSNLALADL